MLENLLDGWPFFHAIIEPPKNWKKERTATHQISQFLSHEEYHLQKYSFPLSELCSKLKIFPTVDFVIHGQFKEALVIISIYISLSFEIEL